MAPAPVPEVNSEAADRMACTSPENAAKLTSAERVATTETKLTPPAVDSTCEACISENTLSECGSVPEPLCPSDHQIVLSDKNTLSAVGSAVRYVLIDARDDVPMASGDSAFESPEKLSSTSGTPLTSSGIGAAPLTSANVYTARRRRPNQNVVDATASAQNKNNSVACQSNGEPLRPALTPAVTADDTKLDKNQSWRARKRQRESLKCRCNYCGDILTLHAIKQHIERHTGCETTVFCSICHMSCGTREKLREHIRIVHNQDKPFRCDACNYRFSTKHNYESHLKTQSHQLVLDGKKEPTPQRLGKQEPPAKTIDERMQLKKCAKIADGPEYVVLPDNEQDAASLYHAQKKSSRSDSRKRGRAAAAAGGDDAVVSNNTETQFTRHVQLGVEIFRENFCMDCKLFLSARALYDEHMRVTHNHKPFGAQKKRNKKPKNSSVDGFGTACSAAASGPEVAGADDVALCTKPQITYWQKIDVNCEVAGNWRQEDTLDTIYRRRFETTTIDDGDERDGSTTLVQQLHKLEQLLAFSSSSCASSTISENVTVENKSVLNARACPGACKLEEFVKVQARHIVHLEQQLRSLRVSSSIVDDNNNNEAHPSKELSQCTAVVSLTYNANNGANTAASNRSAIPSYHAANVSAVVPTYQPVMAPENALGPYASGNTGGVMPISSEPPHFAQAVSQQQQQQSRSAIENAVSDAKNALDRKAMTLYEFSHYVYNLRHNSDQLSSGSMPSRPVDSDAASQHQLVDNSNSFGHLHYTAHQPEQQPPPQPSTYMPLSAANNSDDGTSMDSTMDVEQQQQLVDPAYLSRLFDYGWRMQHVIVEEDDEGEELD